MFPGLDECDIHELTSYVVEEADKRGVELEPLGLYDVPDLSWLEKEPPKQGNTKKLKRMKIPFFRKRQRGN